MSKSAKSGKGAKKKSKAAKKTNDKSKSNSGVNVVGVDLGGTKILARMVDPTTGRAVGRVKRPTPQSGPIDVLDAVAEVVREVEGWEEASAIGVGIPGPVTTDGIVSYCPNIAGWDYPIDAASELASRLGKPVAVANDVNCGAVAEHRVGAARGEQSMMAVFVGTGVGGGLVLDDKLVVGGRGQVGEIGHVTVVPNGRPCGCGGRGHLETYAGRAGINRQARMLAEQNGPNFLTTLVSEGTIKSRHLAQGAEEGDPVTLELLAQAADALATAIGNVATVNDLPLVVLGGGIVDRLGEDFLDQIRNSEVFGGLGADFVRLALAKRLDDAGAVGAAILAADMPSSERAKQAPVLAAGCVVYRQRENGAVEVLVAHRPTHDDWDFPKGHVDPGETEQQAALRETEEEVGARGEIVTELPRSRYQVRPRGAAKRDYRDKTIRWWLLRQTEEDPAVDDASFEPNDEVDEIRWVGIDKAAELLTYDDRRNLLLAVAAAVPGS